MFPEYIDTLADRQGRKLGEKGFQHLCRGPSRGGVLKFLGLPPGMSF